MINVGIIGISGYSGKLLLKILLNHPDVHVTYVGAHTTTGKITDIHPDFFGKTRLVCEKFNLAKAKNLCDLFFIAVPHTKSMEITPGLIKAKKMIIDLSADYRIKDSSVYKKWYGVAHKDKKNLPKSIYGLPELYREEIKKAKFVANPGCYPTAGILALAPLVATHNKKIASIIIDAKSGVSGAGRKAALNLIYAEVNENLKAYKALCHQHTPEICAYLSRLAKRDIKITFVPHLIPMNYGILETIYIQLKSPMAAQEIYKLYQKFYKTEKFVRILKPEKQPETKNVTGTNYCDIGFAVKDNMVVITSVIDNLMKGASSQAVQNMNLMCGFKEEAGLS
ncbi:MAG: N-acetyl-gamma-glutamyl-phosphate reductase [Candidatus Omnitrophica bacterium]|nr:N-acetyl-gamma-glutamyl-phosphate reductase [Candidatus Omnitrophota bacterium]